MAKHRINAYKRIFSALMSVMLVISGIQMSSRVSFADDATEQVWDGSSVDTSWYTEHSSDKTFYINSAAELAGLAELVNEGVSDFDNKTLILGSDIDLGGDAVSGKNIWKPIGMEISLETGSGLVIRKSRYFLGRFDGNGHEIKNLYVNDALNGSALFGTVSGIAEIKGLTVSGTVISTELSTGGIIGRIPYQMETVTVSDCVNNCSIISSTSHTGGIIGYNGGGDIIRCINNGNVTVTASRSGNGVAGIAGSLACGSIQQCVNNGDIKLLREKDAETDLNLISAGGISGLMNSVGSDAYISDCYDRGNVSSESESEYAGCGGIVGKTDSAGSIKNCYSTGTITGKEGHTGGVAGIRADEDKTSYENNYYLEGTVNRANGGLSGQQEKDEANNTYARASEELKGLADGLGGMFTSDSTSNINDGYPVLKWQLGIPTDPEPDPGSGWDGKTSDTSWYDGHESDISYTIATPEALYGMAEIVKSGINFKGKTVKLAADIDLNGMEWTPIGQQPVSVSSARENNNFAGTFDGNGYCVKNFTVTQNCAGLFSVILESAQISGLGIEDAIITSAVENSYSAGGAGSIAAIVKNTSSSAPEIRNCWAGRNVEIQCAKAGAGGIAASAASSLSSYKKPVISGCVNYADVNGMIAGGIFASGAPEISNCYNAGIISGTGGVSGYTGGILGYPENSSAQISYTYNAGTVIGNIDALSTTVKTGAICGSSKGPVFKDVYYLEGSSSAGHAAGGVQAENTTALTAERLKSASSRLNLDQEKIWSNDVSLNNGYPVLSWQKEIEASAPSAQQLKIAQPPDRTEYGEGEYIDLTGMKVVIIYSDGYERTIKHYEISPDVSHMVTAGMRELKISCSGMEATQPLTVKTAQGIRVSQPPEKTEYISGERFSAAGMVIELVYSDGSTAPITDYTLSPSSSEQLTGSVDSIKINFGELATQQKIHVKTPVGVHIEKQPDKTSYIVSDYFKTDGMLVYVDFNDGTSARTTSFSYEPKQFTSADENTEVTVTCTEYKNLPSEIFNVKVSAAEKIEIANMPSKTTYKEGEKFSSAGMTVTATFADGETKEISSGYNGYALSADANRKLTRNVKEIKLTYQGCEAVCPITVEAADTGTPSLSVTKKSTFKDKYKEGEFISSSAMDVKYMPGDNAAKAIALSSSDFTYSPQRVTADTKYITVSYGGYSQTLDVNVQPAESMEVTGLDGKVFHEGDIILDNSIYVNLKFSDGTSSRLSAGYTRTPNASAPLDINTKEMTVRFGERECTVPLTVKAKTAPVTSSAQTGMISMPAEIELSTATEDAKIYYNTDGRRLAISKNEYTGPIRIEGDTLIQAYAVSDDGGESEISYFNYIARGKTSPVKADKQPQIFDETIEIELSTNADNAQIYYTLDGSVPDAESILYESPIKLTDSAVINAVAVKDGLFNSDISSFAYTKRGTTDAVKASPEPGTITMPADIMLSSDTPGAKIYYTTDGTEPTAASALYTGPISITEDTVIKAFAVSDELKDSLVSEFKYTKKSASPSGGGGGGGSSSSPSAPAAPAEPSKPAGENNGISNTSSFSDVASGAWYFDAVKYVSEKGLMNGVSSSIFAPQGGVTRGMFVTVLGRMTGVDTSKYVSSGFKDVAEGSYYGSYVAWARENGIVSGISEDSFAPDRMISRQEMAVMIYKMKLTSDKASYVFSENDLAALNDRQDIALWAKEGTAFCVKNGIMQGKSGGIFDPSGKAVRAELAVLLQRLDKQN